jgi:hypothetical protein
MPSLAVRKIPVRLSGPHRGHDSHSAPLQRSQLGQNPARVSIDKRYIG